MDQRTLLSLTPFVTDPPQNGGQVVIRAVNGALAAGGWRVEQFSLGIRRPDLKRIGRDARREVAPGYVETRYTDAANVMAFSAASWSRHPYVWAGAILAHRPWAALQRQLPHCSAVLLEMPWAYHAALRLRPAHVPLVYMAHNAEHVLLTDAPAIVRKQGEDQERAALQAADVVVLIAEEDRALLERRYHIDLASAPVLARGLSLDRYAPVTASERAQRRFALGFAPDERLVVFAGSAHGPNARAVDRVLSLAVHLPGARFVVTGRAAQWLHSAPANVVGRPGDPLPYLQVADVALNLVESGSGMNVKMIEYLACGLPIITTPFGARGLSGVAGDHYLVAEPDDVGGVLATLLDSPWRRQAMRAAARGLAEAHYSAASTAEALTDLIYAWRARQAVLA
jgi:glycosyltransferase involved in cell wall biosynthesis